MAVTDIRYRILPDSEHTRLVRKYPGLDKGYENWCPTCDKNQGPRVGGKFLLPGGALVETCDCQKQVALFKWYAASGIGANYMRLDWHDYANQEILSGVRKYLDNHESFLRQGMGLYLSGDIGVGKTMLLNLVLKDLVKLGYTCFATTFAQMIEMYTATWADRDEKVWFQRKFLNSQFLLLDDVGKERDTKIALNETTFDAVLRQRVTDGRPTFISTNPNASEMEERYGQAILSLIREQSLEEVVTGNDYRPKANERRVHEVLKGWTRAIV